MASDQHNSAQVLNRFLEAEVELEAFESDIITRQAVAQHIGLENDAGLIKIAIDHHLRLKNLAHHPGTDEYGAFMVTQKGRRTVIARRGY